MRHGIVAGALSVVVMSFAACGGPHPPDAVTLSPPTIAPSASASAGAAAPPARDPSNPAAWEGATWADEEVAAALAKDCHWDPGGCMESLLQSAAKSTDGITPERPECMPVLAMACAQVPGQTCVPDECSQSDYDCVPACNGDCFGCGAKCADGCETCKAKCSDDACRLACGKQCAACRQECLKTLDHCTTAHCAEVSEECFRSRYDEWNAGTCDKVCPRVAACVEKCPQIENDWTGELYATPCAKSCLTRLGKGCPARFDRICAGDPNASVNFNVFHFSRNDQGK